MECFPITYGDEFPFEQILPDELVYIVDYSITPVEMLRLKKITPNVVWIDHHKTAIDAYGLGSLPESIEGVRQDGVAACMLTFQYLFPKKDVPMFTELIADWDVWKFKYGDATRRFVTAFNAYDFSPESREWDTLKAGPVRTSMMIAEGENMIRYRDGWAADYVQNLGYRVIFEGHRCFAVNLGRCNSEFFKSLDSQYEIYMPYVFNGEYYAVSLYSTTVDVSEIAVKYRGGGHKGAAGFQCRVLPFAKYM
jgi:oligoribonuclease NrnB/cAMP/cGMP phosphodiesterase (DHH superfamily)